MFKTIVRILTLILILLCGGLVFAGGGANMMILRDYDASIGLISRPKNTFSQIAKILGPVEVSAQCSIGPCATEPSLREYISKFDIERTLNKLLRELVLSFIKGLLEYLTNLFNKLLSLVEQWANTVLGIKLNLSHIRRFVALQSYKLYNQLEGEVNRIFDNLFEPLKQVNSEVASNVANTVAEAAATVELANADQAACIGTPDQCSSSPSASPQQLRQDFESGLAGILQESCIAFQLAPIQSRNKLEDAVLATHSIVKYQCLNIAPGLAEAMGQLDKRTSQIKQQAAEATKAENLKKADSQSCAPVIRSDQAVFDAKKSFSPDSNLSISSNVTFRNPVVVEASSVTEGKLVVGLTQAECDLANQALQSSQAVSEANVAKNAPQSENLADVLLKLIQDFFDEIFKKLEEIILKVINDVLQNISNLINRIGIREISGPMGRVFGQFSSQVNNSLREMFRLARNDLKQSISQEIRPNSGN